MSSRSALGRRNYKRLLITCAAVALIDSRAKAEEAPLNLEITEEKLFNRPLEPAEVLSFEDFIDAHEPAAGRQGDYVYVTELDAINSEEEFHESFLLLQITSGDFTLSQGTSTYEYGDRLYISLYELVESLMFPIDVFDEERRAEGWFLEPKNDFYLSASDKKVIIRGDESELSETDIKFFDDEIYVDSAKLREWFGIDFILNYSQLTLDITSEEMFVFQERAERKDKWKKASNKRKTKRKKYPLKENPYKFFEFPSSTIQSGYTYDKAGELVNTSRDYSIQGSGDLFKMSSDFFINGGDEDWISDARLRLYRVDENEVIEGTGIKSFEIGDVSPQSLDIVGSGGVERGVSFSNRPIGQTLSPDNLTIDGEVEAGWEVEIYRNGDFLAFQENTSDGRFEFNGISLDAGLNLFKIVKYGPFGEKEEEFRRFFIGQGMLKQDEFYYDFSFTQPEMKLLPVDEDYSLGGNNRVVANFEYGVNENLSLAAGLYSGPLYDQSRDGALVSLRSSYLGVYSKLDHLQNSDETSVSSISQKMSFGRFNINTAALYNDGFDEEDQDREFLLSADVGTFVGFEGISDISFRFGAEYEKFQTDRKETRFNAQTATSIHGFALSNTVNMEIEESGDQVTETVNGDFFFRRRFDDFVFGTDHDFLFRANMGYEVEPVQEVKSMNLRLEKNLDDDIRMRLNSAHTFGEVEDTTYQASLNYDHDYFSTSFAGNYNTQGDFGFGINLRFYVGGDEKSRLLPNFILANSAQGGTARIHSYLDQNYDGIFNDGDEPLEDVRFKTRDGKVSITNEQGKGVIAGLVGHKTTDVSIMTESLPDIFYAPVNEGYTVSPRPGNDFELSFPVVVGAELDGFVELPLEKAEVFDFNQIAVEVVDSDGEVVKRSIPDETGYYFFSQIIPNKYKVRISEDAVDQLRITGTTEREIEFDLEDPVITDLILAVDIPMDLPSDNADSQQPLIEARKPEEIIEEPALPKQDIVEKPENPNLPEYDGGFVEVQPKVIPEIIISPEDAELANFIDDIFVGEEKIKVDQGEWEFDLSEEQKDTKAILDMMDLALPMDLENYVEPASGKVIYSSASSEYVLPSIY